MEPRPWLVELVYRRCLLFPNERRSEPGADHRRERASRGASSPDRAAIGADQEMTLVTLADERYALPLAVLGRSLSEHIRSDGTATLYIVDGGIEPRHEDGGCSLLGICSGSALHSFPRSSARSATFRSGDGFHRSRMRGIRAVSRAGRMQQGHPVGFRRRDPDSDRATLECRASRQDVCSLSRIRLCRSSRRGAAASLPRTGDPVSAIPTSMPVSW